MRTAQPGKEPPDAEQIKLAVYGTPLPEPLRVEGPVRGAFTSASTEQWAYLLIRADRDNSMIAVFDTVQREASDEPAETDKARADASPRRRGELLSQFVTDEPYMSMPAAIDIDSSGGNGDEQKLDELLLIQYGYQMGVSLASVDIVSLAGSRYAEVATEPFVLRDSCNSTLPDRAFRASRLRVTEGGALERDDFETECP
ncbi:MAG: hypothetical protein CSB44_03460 [Gammaproteobacteria bacterium]|nr:MAG: hypothetical protein CSB44_03460 [Gammaproteobacteria bacterium]